MSSRSPARSTLLVVSGICREESGPGGWGFVVCLPTGVEEEGGGACLDETSKERMELTAAIEGFRFLNAAKGRAASIRVVSSSQYLVECARGKRERGGNADLWALLEAQVKGRTVAWEWEPPDTMFIQTQALEMAQSALRQALMGGGPEQR
jgi:ribonuclease HI